MATNDTIIRAPVNTAGQTATFHVDKYPIRVSLYPVADLTTSEFADLQIEDPAGTFGDVWDATFNGASSQVRLSDVLTDIVVRNTGTYRINVANPTNAIGVYIREVRTG